jgi:hypothetical protein
MTSRPRKIDRPVWALISRIEGSASTISPTAPTHTTGLRPIRSERMPTSGMVSSATTMTANCRSWDVVSETDSPPCMSGIVAVT